VVDNTAVTIDKEIVWGPEKVQSGKRLIRHMDYVRVRRDSSVGGSLP